MKTVAIVPVKSLLHSKSRLSTSLTPQERAMLTRATLAHVLETIEASDAVDAVAVVSPTPEELYLPIGVTALTQRSEGLNNALEQGREWALRQRAHALMVVFSDLPTLSPGDIEAIVDAGEPDNTVVLAPDRHGQGTNAMLLHPPQLAPFAFGAMSLEKHLTAAYNAGANLHIYRSGGSSLDIDTPDDLAMLERSRLAAAG